MGTHEKMLLLKMSVKNIGMSDINGEPLVFVVKSWVLYCLLFHCNCTLYCFQGFSTNIFSEISRKLTLIKDDEGGTETPDTNKGR